MTLLRHSDQPGIVKECSLIPVSIEYFTQIQRGFNLSRILLCYVIIKARKIVPVLEWPRLGMGGQLEMVAGGVGVNGSCIGKSKGVNM